MSNYLSLILNGDGPRRTENEAVVESSRTPDLPEHYTPDMIQAAEILMSLRYAEIEEGAQVLGSMRDNSNTKSIETGNIDHSHQSGFMSNSFRASSVSSDKTIDGATNVQNLPLTKSSEQHTEGHPMITAHAARSNGQHLPESAPETMSKDGDRGQSARPISRTNANIDASVSKFTDEITAPIGGEPARNARTRRRSRYIEQKARRHEADTKWPQIQNAKQYIDNMGQKKSHTVGTSGEVAEPRKSIKTTKERRRQISQRNGWTTGEMDLKAEANVDDASKNVASRKRRRGMDQAGNSEQPETPTKNRAMITVKVGAIRPKPTNAGETPAPVSTTLSPNSEDNPDGESNSRSPKKRRRTLGYDLESDLGKKWEAQIDEEGHRPARKAKRVSNVI